MIREEIKNLLKKAIKNLYKKEVEVEIERPAESVFGDYATNIAMIIKKDPQEIADSIKSDILEKIEVKNGFINFFISKEYLQKRVEEVLKKKEKYGNLKIGKGQKVNIEFISANPTGPLHIGNARGGFCGDVLANVLEKAGYKEVFREYYINDMGRQILFLENSLNEREPSYKNQYIDELKAKGEKNVKKAVEYIVGEIKGTTAKMGIEFNRWFYESSLERERKEIMDFLGKKNLIYEKEGAFWFKSTQFGDDKDRVLKRAQEKTTYHEETYFLSDIAYLKNKFKRGFDYLIFFLGAEHHGYAPRLKAAVQALGYNRDRIKPIIMQLVKLVEEGKEVRMSKRTGIFVTIDELIKEIHKDVARFFFLTRNYGNHLLFDLDLAKEQSEKNPVFYIQYAHARICSILRKASGLKFNISDLKLLTHQSELQLIKQLIRFPEIIEDTARDYQVQRIPQYALDLATSFHQFYRDCQVISENKNLTQARLGLISATKIVFKNTLNLMGISVPEKM